jgi:peptidyl-prolyl cis-trans isomerase D
VMNQAFKINVNKLPAYAGFMDTNKAYTIVEVSRLDRSVGDADAKKAAEEELKAALAAEYVSAYGKSLKAKAKIEVNQKLLASSNE